MSSNPNNEFRSLCIAMHDAAACRGLQNTSEAGIPAILNWTHRVISSIVRQPATIRS